MIADAPQIQDIVDVLEGAERTLHGWVAACPRHTDVGRSLRLAECNGQVAVRCVSCHQGSAVAESITRALAPATRGLLPPHASARPRLAASYASAQ